MQEFLTSLSLQVKHAKDSFLALTTDGINFLLSDQEICDVINQCQDPTEAANVIAQQVTHKSVALFLSASLQLLTLKAKCSPTIVERNSGKQKKSKLSGRGLTTSDVCLQALQYGSDDNATIVIVPFGAWGKHQNSTAVYSMSRNFASSGRWA